MVSRRENFHGSRIKRAFNKGIGTKAEWTFCLNNSF